MSKFQFRLAGLLRIRESARDDRRMHLAEVQRADAELQGQLARLELEQKQLQRESRKVASPGAVDVPRLVEAQQYASALRAQQTELRRRRETLAGEIDRRREAVIEADREVRTLEKLCENQAQAHRQAEDQQEGKLLDEAALQMDRN
jgi:flagellar protein FliJ